MKNIKYKYASVNFIAVYVIIVVQNKYLKIICNTVTQMIISIQKK